MSHPSSPPLPECVPGPRFALDRRICVIANRWGARRITSLFFGAVSRLGDGLFWYLLMAGMIVLDGYRGLAAAAHMAGTGVVALLLYRGLKKLTRRPRPYRACAGVIARIPPLDEFSFPSGHTLHAVSFSIVAVAWYPPLALFVLGFSALVAASRVILGLHYPSDVLAAIAIGSSLGMVSVWLTLPLL